MITPYSEHSFTNVIIFNSHAVSPNPLPTKVDIKIDIYDIVGVNEADQTGVNVLLKIENYMGVPG